MSYDAANNLLKQIDALGNTVATFSYDSNNNPISKSDALGNTQHAIYDELNRVSQLTDPLTRISQFSYDALNRLTASLDALMGLSLQGFDIDGNRDLLSDPNTNHTQFKTDNNGRLQEESVATGDKVQYTYNARDLLTKMTNARGQQRQFIYDAAGRMTSFTDPDGTVSFTYDNNNNILTVTDVNGTITRQYDALNRITQYTDNQGNTIGYRYDEVGNLIVLTYPDDKQVYYEYDAANRLVKVTDWSNRITQYQYDANGRLINTIRPNGTVQTRSYNANGQLLQQIDSNSNNSILAQFDFRYDAAGNIVQEINQVETVPILPNSVEMTYTAANRLATYNGQVVSFDKDGNLLTAPLKGQMSSLQFDSRNRLIQAGNTTYRYDAENQRVAVNQTRFVVNSQPALSQVLVKTEADGTKTFYVYGLGLIGEETNGQYRAYLFDFRGSTVALTDGSGQVTQRFQYSAYGELVSGDSTQTPFLFNGMYGVMTDGSGLYYMRARYYSPEIKRFLNQDVLLGEVSDGQSLNRFAFVTGNPVSFVDPFGLDIRSLSPVEKQMVTKAIKQINDYGFTGEARALMIYLGRGQIRIDTELFKSEKALGEAGKFFEWINLAPELFGMHFDLYIVPTIAHEYAHILDYKRCVIPLDKSIFHGLTLGYFAEDFPNKVTQKMLDLYLEKQQSQNRKEGR